MKKEREIRHPQPQKRKKRAGKKVFPEFVGKAQMSRDGFIFVIVEGEEQDIFVPVARTRGALNGDTVRVAVTKEASDSFGRKNAQKAQRREGTVIEIIERSERPFVGIYHTVGARAWVLMQSKFMPYDIEVDAEQAAEMGALRGMKVAARVDRWNRGDSTPIGHIVDVLGMPGANETEMHAILAEFNLPYKFDPEVERAAAAISPVITSEDLKDRKDFRDILTFTIDPADAKDFDDALSFRPLSNGNYEVGVHIADVSHYVTPDSLIDTEALARGTSVYLVDRTVPMLPEALCNNLCSLRPHEDKLTFSAVFEMTPDAKVRKTWLGRTVINSDFRLDYAQAQEIIESFAAGRQGSETVGSADPTADAVPPLMMPRVAQVSDPSCQSAPNTESLKHAIQTLNGMAEILKKRRFKAGAIDFNRPEMKVEVDAEGRPVNIYQKYSKEANFLIEEFMLLANRSVAEFVSKINKTFVYRIHDNPDPMKLMGLKDFAKGFGYKMGEKLEGKAAARELSQLLTKSKDKPEHAAFEDIALRAMAKAKYSTDNIGHYGLAFTDYTHFTSPIRRYPDLMVHRLLASYLAKGKSENKDYYEDLCKHCSTRESIAADAERTSVKYKLVEYMQNHLGEEFDGHISGVTEWGMYVEVEPTHIEGMVPLREIKGDFFEFDEKKYRLFGRRTHKVFRLGDPVRIRVASANLEQRLLDFELIENQNL